MVSLVAKAKTPISMHSEGRVTGFTLLELLVVLTIAALVAGAALLWLPKALESARFREAVLKIQAAFMMAKHEARQSGTTHWVVYDQRERTLYLDERPWYRLPEGIALEWTVADLGLGADRAAIVFRPEGGNTGGTVIVRRQGQATAVRVDWLLGLVENYPITP